jgi:hypothetical protein
LQASYGVIENSFKIYSEVKNQDAQAIIIKAGSHYLSELSA